ASASRPPVSTVTVTTGRPVVSASHGMQKEVSSPPEKASTIGSAMASPFFEKALEALDEACLVARAGRRDEDGVVAGHGADDLGPGGAVHGQGHGLRRADGGGDDQQVGARRLEAAEEVDDLPEAGVRRLAGGRDDIAAGHPGD